MKTAPTPVWVAEVDLGRSLYPEGVSRPQQPGDAAVRILVRSGHQVVGFVTLPSPSGGLSREAVDAAIASQLSVPLWRSSVPETPCAPPHAEFVSVVVCTRDRPELLAVSLEALRQLKYPEYEVIVVDSASTTEATRNCFERTVGADGRFRYVREPVPGLSRARNRGLAEARARYVAFTDDDTHADAWWLRGIAEGFARVPGAGCVTGLVPPSALDRPAQQYFDRRFSWASRLEPTVFRLTRHDDPSSLFPYSAGVFGTGANFAVDRVLLTDLGGFDEALGAGSPAAGGEELDAFIRVLRAGRPIVYEPSAVVWHVHRGDPRAARRQLFGYGVGLTAFLSKYLLDATTTRDILARVPPGLRRMWRMWSPAVLDGRPTALVLTEAAGMAVGPFAYLWSRTRLRRQRHR